MISSRLSKRVSAFLVFGLVVTMASPRVFAELKVLYTFDDGTVNDSSGNGFHGTFQGDAKAAVDSDLVLRGSSNVLELDGSDDYVEVPPLGGDVLTCSFAMWIKPNASSLSDLHHIFNDTSWVPGSFHWSVRDGYLRCHANEESDLVGGTYLPAEQWVHVAAVRDGAYQSLYVDGEKEAQQSMNPGRTIIFGGGFHVGAWKESREFDGRIDDVRVFDHALNEGEIWSLSARAPDYKAGNPLPADGASTVSVNTDLSWFVRSSVDGYRVYLGKTQPLPLVSEQTDTVYIPDSPLQYNTNYYWRVDTVRNGQVTTGDIWRFTTQMEPLNTSSLGFEEIVFIKRKPYSSDHYYTVINNGTSSDRFHPDNGIYVYNSLTNQERPVIKAADIPGSGKGVIGKFTLSFDATKVVFDYRQDTSSGFRIWEVNLDGTSLRQVIPAPLDEAAKVARWGKAFHTDDIDPAYLPDGSIIFSSSRCEHTILCGGSAQLAAAVLHRADANGQNVEQLTQSPVSEFCPVVLDDGRVMYHRWEYIDKGHRTPKTIWSMNPDGTKSQELFGLSESYYNTGAHMYPQPIPGRDDLIVMVSAPHYPQGNSLGPIQLVDLNLDNRSLAPLTNITPDVRMGTDQKGWLFAFDDFHSYHTDGRGGPLYTHPWPLNEQEFLVSYKYDHQAHYRDVPNAYAIYLINSAGEHRFVHMDPEQALSCWHPTPLMARSVPLRIYSFRHPQLQAENQALCIVTNIYEGMDNVEPGQVKYLRINEAVPRYWDSRRKWSPSFTSNVWKTALWTRVQWGVVPVEPDGSAHFLVPADRNIFFQALDENFREIQRERTYVNYRPGELRSCIGCHEQTGRAAPSISLEAVMALQRGPDQPQAQPCDDRPEQVIHFPAHIQPIFDRHCITCHGAQNPKAGLSLVDDITEYYSRSYEELLRKELAGPSIPEFGSWNSGKGGGNDQGSYLPPYSLGSYTSKLVSVLETDSHNDPHRNILSDLEMMVLCRWVDSNYQFYGTYYGRHHSAHYQHQYFRREPTFEEAVDRLAPYWHE